MACARSLAQVLKRMPVARLSFAWKWRPKFKLMAAVLLMDEKHRKMRIQMATHTHTLVVHGRRTHVRPNTQHDCDQNEFDWLGNFHFQNTSFRWVRRCIHKLTLWKLDFHTIHWIDVLCYCSPLIRSFDLAANSSWDFPLKVSLPNRIPFVRWKFTIIIIVVGCSKHI